MRPVVVGAMARVRSSAEVGQVERLLEEGVLLRFANGSARAVPLEQLGCGLEQGMEVQEWSPEGQGIRGVGKVLTLVPAGLHILAVVEFSSGEIKRLPWQNLRVVWSYQAFYQGRASEGVADTERFRLRQLGLALRHWNLSTGALSPLDLDPLPHQLEAVGRIVRSGNYSWLIADDVGLGKTIEVGLLLAALLGRGLRRILLVVPAGLTRQWQEELKHRFGMAEFEVYGRDFEVHDSAQWPIHSRVIASMDRLKSGEHLERVKASGQWDLVVFDEAHRLGRSTYGFKQDATERYRLAQQLRSQSEHLLLLTATPHQGKLDRFTALLELLRPGPEWKRRLDALELHPQLLSELVIRNRKADVTDLDGNFIFQGKHTHTLALPMSPDEQAFERALIAYLREGYRAGDLGGNQGMAIGFTMTTYRKLAASSLAALLAALERRAARLDGRWNSTPEARLSDTAQQDLDAEELNDEETAVTPQRLFFEGEREALKILLEHGRSLRDHKLEDFMKALTGQILRDAPAEKVLVFTEYRGTQSALVEALERRAPGRVALLNGSMDLTHRRAALEHFEGEAQFLVSTEAGGEGLNLQRRCHRMVNFDLPWNPMRLVQRVGRLYRYGQTRTVQVYNLYRPGSADEDILALMYQRLEAVARDMAGVSEEYSGIVEDVLGDLAASLDVEALLEEAGSLPPERSRERLEAALERARRAGETQGELMSHASRFDPQTLGGELALSRKHLERFVAGMISVWGGEVLSRGRGGEFWLVRLPDFLREKLGWNKNVRLVFDARLAQASPEFKLIDGKSRLLTLMFEKAEDYDFGGWVGYLPLQGQDGVCALLHWQDNSGRTLRSKYVMLERDGTHVRSNPPEFSDWLLSQDPGEPPSALEPEFKPLEAALNRLLEEGAVGDALPGGFTLCGVGWGYATTL